MTEHPAVRRAKILAHYGRVSQAESELREALRSDPQNTELLLAVLDISRKPGKSGGIQHQLMGWVLFICALTLAMSPLIIGIRTAEKSFPALPDQTLFVVAGIGLFIVAIVAHIVAGMYLFLWLWFKYLARLPVDDRNFAEGKLALSMNLYSMEPQYSKVRKRMLGSARADA